ncbi:hypothetical protein ACJX0J_030189 [Zea mays]
MQFDVLEYNVIYHVIFFNKFLILHLFLSISFKIYLITNIMMGFARVVLQIFTFLFNLLIFNDMLVNVCSEISSARQIMPYSLEYISQRYLNYNIWFMQLMLMINLLIDQLFSLPVISFLLLVFHVTFNFH